MQKKCGPQHMAHMNSRAIGANTNLQQHVHNQWTCTIFVEALCLVCLLCLLRVSRPGDDRREKITEIYFVHKWRDKSSICLRSNQARTATWLGAHNAPQCTGQILVYVPGQYALWQYNYDIISSVPISHIACWWFRCVSKQRFNCVAHNMIEYRLLHI